MLIRSLAAAFCVLVSATAASAQQFPTFSVDRFEGWIENTGTNDGQIVVYPAIIEPGAGLFWRDPSELTGFWSVDPFVAPPPQGLDVTSQGRLKFSYRIMADARYLPGNLREQISQQSNIPLNLLERYTVTFARAESYKAVELSIGEQVWRHDLGAVAIVGPYREGSFYFDADDADLKNALREGDFQLTLVAQMPVASFSSINLDLSVTAVTTSWMKAFREVSRKTRRSGFNAGFIDFSSSVQKIRVEEEIRSDTNTRIDSSATIVMRAPTPAQLTRFEQLFGFVTQSETEMLAAHRAGHAAAVIAGALNLADAHDQYIKEIEANAPGNSEKIIEALAKLSDSEAMKFMTSGFKMSLGSTTTSYKYNAESIISSTTTMTSEYNEYIIDNAIVETRTVNYRNPNGGNLADLFGGVSRRIHERVFGAGSINSGMRPANTRDWATGVAGAIDRQHLGDISYAFVDLLEGPVIDPVLTRNLVDPNVPIDANGNGLLHRAVRVGDQEVVRLLLRNGVNPNRANRYGDTPRDTAEAAGRAEIANTLRAAEAHQGESVWRISHPGMRLVAVQVGFPSAPGQTTLTPIDATTSSVTVRGYPHRSWANAAFTYEFVIPANQAASIQFPHQGQIDGNTYRVRAAGFFWQPYRIRSGSSDSVEINLVYGGPQMGFVPEGGMFP